MKMKINLVIDVMWRNNCNFIVPSLNIKENIQLKLFYLCVVDVFV